MHFIALLAMFLPYGIHLNASSIWDASEAFYAETAREMLASGDYVAPRFNYQVRAQKPPLTYWAILLSYKIFGVNEFAVRFPSAVAAFGLLLFSYGLARILFGPGAGLIAAMIAATTPRIFILARRLPIDMLLLFFLSGALFFLVRALKTKEKSSWLLAYFCTSLAFLTKGPVAVIIPWVSFLVWILWSRRARISEAHPWMGLGVFSAVVLPWYVLVYRIHGWTYIAPFFLKDNLGRFATETMGPSRGPFYYFSVYAIDFIPWSIIAVFAVFLLWKERNRRPPLKTLAFGLPLIWCGVTFLLFSLSKNKQEYYIAPIYPAVAAMISGIFNRSARIFKGENRSNQSANSDFPPPQPHSESFWSAASASWIPPFAFAAFFMIVLGVLTPYILASFLPDVSRQLRVAPSVVFCGGAAALGWSIIRKKHATGFLVLAISLWTVFLMGALFYVPALESFRPVKRFCTIIEAQSSGREQIGTFKIALPSMVFYLQRPIFEETSYEGMTRRFKSNDRVFCLLTEEEYGYFADKNVSIYVLDRNERFSLRLKDLWNGGRFPGEELLLVSNNPCCETEHIKGP